MREEELCDRLQMLEDFVAIALGRSSTVEELDGMHIALETTIRRRKAAGLEFDSHQSADLERMATLIGCAMKHLRPSLPAD